MVHMYLNMYPVTAYVLSSIKYQRKYRNYIRNYPFFSFPSATVYPLFSGNGGDAITDTMVGGRVMLGITMATHIISSPIKGGYHPPPPPPPPLPPKG